jgi:D-xylose transport system substrate-binding protein
MDASTGSAGSAGAEKLKNGGFEVSTLFLEPIAVTKENLMETVVADGFHSETDVKK